MKKDLITRLNEGPVLCAEGYLFAMERRGYLSAGAFVPEVVLDHPEVLSQLHREFIRSGSEVIQAFTYYGHREKLRIIGKEHLLEPLQKNALQIAKDSIKIGAKVLWGQIGVRNDEAARIAEEAGIKVIMNRCPKIELFRPFWKPKLNLKI